ncbi:STAS domain-containing protein [Mycobacterium conspicuum]|nr:STAS domain-containing protein [Mycobacterium conspicuum]ORV35448.1 anti-anti-sigma factor [Mycobacterium conspicuum]
MESLVVDREARADAVLVRVRGDVDSITVGELHSQLTAARELAATHPARLLVIDLQPVTFFGSAGLNAIYDCREQGLAAGTSVRLVAADNEYVLRPLEVTKLDRVFEVHRTLTDALGNTDRQEREQHP